MKNEDFKRSDKSGPFNLSRGLNSGEEVVFALNAFALLLCRSLLGGGFDKANDVMSTAFPGPVGAGWFKYHLISHITTHTHWWFLSEFAVADSLSSYLVSPRLASFPLADFEPQKGMDRYLDSLFDPVLSEGSEVRYIIHSLRHTWPPERGFFGQQFTFTASYCTAALSSIFNEPQRSKNKIKKKKKLCSVPLQWNSEFSDLVFYLQWLYFQTEEGKLRGLPWRLKRNPTIKRMVVAISYSI